MQQIEISKMFKRIIFKFEYENDDKPTKSIPEIKKQINILNWT